MTHIVRRNRTTILFVSKSFHFVSTQVATFIQFFLEKKFRTKITEKQILGESYTVTTLFCKVLFPRNVGEREREKKKRRIDVNAGCVEHSRGFWFSENYRTHTGVTKVLQTKVAKKSCHSIKKDSSAFLSSDCVSVVEWWRCTSLPVTLILFI